MLTLLLGFLKGVLLIRAKVPILKFKDIHRLICYVYFCLFFIVYFYLLRFWFCIYYFHLLVPRFNPTDVRRAGTSQIWIRKLLLSFTRLLTSLCNRVLSYVYWFSLSFNQWNDSAPASKPGCNWACKLTDGCLKSLKSCVRPHLLAYATEIKSTQLHAAPLWLG